MSNDKLSRRNILKLLGTGGLVHSPLFALLNAVISEVNNQAYAATVKNPGCYLHLWMPGGPARHTSDLLLTPYDEDMANFVRAPQMGTGFRVENNEYVDVAWETVKKYGLNVPVIWNAQAPAPNNANRRMDDLLKNLLCARGFFVSNINSHPLCEELVKRGRGPVAPCAIPSQLAHSPFPGVSVGEIPPFDNPLSMSPILATGSSNLIEAVLSPFLGTSLSNTIANDSGLKAAMKKLQTASSLSAKKHHPNISQNTKSLETARELLAMSFGDLSQSWDGLLDKYKDICDRAMDPSWQIPGINDKAIRIKEGNYIETSGGDNASHYPADVRQAMSTETEVLRMPQAFALAEFLFTSSSNGSPLTYSLFANLGNCISKVNTTFSRANNNANQWTNDEHIINRMVLGLVHAHFNCAFGGCAMELRSKLQEKNLWENSVINISGEFCRKPGTREGTDHGIQGYSPALYSGALDKPMVLGNIGKAGGNAVGTWGHAAECKEFDIPFLDLGHMTSTLAVLLGGDSPYPEKPSIIKREDGKIVPVIGKPTII